MLSITRYLAGSKTEPADSRLRALSLLVEAVAVHAVDIDHAARADFQAEVRGIGETIDKNPESDNCLLATGQIIHSLHQYHRATERFSAARQRECQSIIDMLTGSLLRLSKSTGETAENLRDLEKQIERATALKDVRAIHAEMKQVLSRIHNQVQLQEMHMQAIKTDVAAAVAVPAPHNDEPTPASETDELTGLPSAREAERAVRSIPGSGHLVFPIAFFVERLDLINNRYGFEAGDQVLMMFSQHLAQKMRQGDQLFRWRGPSFVALFPRGSSTDVRNELKRFAAQKLEHTVNVGGRKVIMTISAAIGVMPSSAEGEPQDILSRIDAFVSEQSSRALVTT